MPPRVFMYEEEEELPRRPSPPLPLNGPILEQIMFVSDSVPSAPPLLDAVGDHSASVPAALPPRQPIPSPPHMYTVPLAYGSLDRAHSPGADLPSVHPRTDLLSGPEPLDPSAPTYGVPPEVPLDRAHSEGGDVPSSVLSDRAAIDPLPMPTRQLNVLPVVLSNNISVDADDGVQFVTTYKLNRDMEFVDVLTPER
ncbi:hypothetical protein C8J57DRAFT_1733876, partial [Mycena rebaudengoi]